MTRFIRWRMELVSEWNKLSVQCLDNLPSTLMAYIFRTLGTGGDFFKFCFNLSEVWLSKASIFVIRGYYFYYNRRFFYDFSLNLIVNEHGQNHWRYPFRRFAFLKFLIAMFRCIFFSIFFEWSLSRSYSIVYIFSDKFHFVTNSFSAYKFSYKSKSAQHQRNGHPNTMGLWWRSPVGVRRSVRF